jgi:hypothetical protein
LALSWPSSPYSSVCSIAIFRYPSKQASTPRYSTPEFNFTRTGRPNTDFKKSEGERFFAASCATERSESVQLTFYNKTFSSTTWHRTLTSLSAVFSADGAAIGSDMFAFSIFVKRACKIDRSDENCAVINVTFGFQNWQAAEKRLYRWYDLVNDQVASAVDHGYRYFIRPNSKRAVLKLKREEGTDERLPLRPFREKQKKKRWVMMVVIIPQQMYACNAKQSSALHFQVHIPLRTNKNVFVFPCCTKIFQGKQEPQFSPVWCADT